MIRLLFLYFLILPTAIAQETPLAEPAPVCEDKIEAKIKLNPKLDSPFFRKTISSRPWHVIEHSSGKLEDTLDGVIDPEDKLLQEHTSNCLSTHMGDHQMNFCDAKMAGEILTLTFSGGLPAYNSTLSVSVAADQNVTCEFQATYPGPKTGLGWKMTKKDIRMRTLKPDAEGRLLGWLSVEFLERSENEGAVVWTHCKIEGYFKPVVRE